MHSPVDFFIIGAPKSGTTSLAHYLRQLESINIPAYEVNFWSKELYPDRNILQTVEEYESYFTRDTADQLLGDKSVSYLYSPDAIKKIQEYNPNARFVVMLRDPTELFFSLHKHNLHKLNESESDPKLVWQREFVTKDATNQTKKHWNAQYQMVCSIGTSLSSAASLIDSEKLHIIFLEDLKQDAAVVHTRVCDFLGVEFDSSIATSVQNQKQTYRSLAMAKTISFLGQIKNKLGIKKRFFLLNKLNAFNKKALTETSYHDSELEETVRKHFTPEVQKIEAVTGRDLRHWYSQT